MIRDPVLEAAALRESEDTLRELVAAFKNIGLEKEQISMMLRAVAEELSPTLIIHQEPLLPQ